MARYKKVRSFHHVGHGKGDGYASIVREAQIARKWEESQGRCMGGEKAVTERKMEESMFENWGPQHWQNVILGITILVTFYMYHRKNLATARNAAMVVMLQIQSIEKNIDTIAKECLDKDGNTPDRNVFYSDNVYEINYWEQNKHILINYLSRYDFKIISDFYDTVSKINCYHRDIKNIVVSGFQSRIINYYNSIFGMVQCFYLCDKDKGVDIDGKELKDSLNNIVNSQMKKFNNVYVPPYIVNEYIFALNKYISVYRIASGTTAFTKLEKLSKRNFW